MTDATWVHPSFLRAAALGEPWRSHFPKTVAEADAFVPTEHVRVLAQRVLVVAVTRVECAWSAYVDAVPGHDHLRETDAVRDHGVKLEERVARVLFPEFHAVPYAN
jgi:hypothetical protein